MTIFKIYVGLYTCSRQEKCNKRFTVVSTPCFRAFRHESQRLVEFMLIEILLDIHGSIVKMDPARQSSSRSIDEFHSAIFSFPMHQHIRAWAKTCSPEWASSPTLAPGSGLAWCEHFSRVLRLFANSSGTTRPFKHRIATFSPTHAKPPQVCCWVGACVGSHRLLPNHFTRRSFRANVYSVSNSNQRCSGKNICGKIVGKFELFSDGNWLM